MHTLLALWGLCGISGRWQIDVAALKSECSSPVLAATVKLVRAHSPSSFSVAQVVWLKSAVLLGSYNTGASMNARLFIAKGGSRNIFSYSE